LSLYDFSGSQNKISLKVFNFESPEDIQSTVITVLKGIFGNYF
jgi:hypothetical protein